tara:strand:- start:107 stop:376 length:270 start_codon:yes stop_codon:yes gene_type:complete
MPGYKNYTIKKYEKGGLVETKTYKDGKLVVAMAPVTKDSEIKGTVKEFVDQYGEKEAQKLIDSFKKPRFKPESNLEKELERRAKDAKPK